MAKRIAPSKDLGYSDMYIDFVSGLHKARHFYALDNIQDVAARLDGIQFDRDRLADIVRAQNVAWGAGERTLANIEALRDPRAVCVFAGQQPGMLTGPMLVILKALGIIKAAERYFRELDRPVVPVFWIAGDDHDFVESNHTYLLDRKTSEPVKVAYAATPSQPIPTGAIRFENTTELEQFKAAVKEALGESDFTAELFATIDRCYTPEDTLVTGFARFLTALVGQFGLVLFSPSDPSVKKLATPFLIEIVEKQEELHRHISQANSQLTTEGYHVQVEKKDRAAYLFCNIEGRTPVMREADGAFSVGARLFSSDELKDFIRREPERFSPDVMTRPVMQSWLFPVLSQKGGPSEIAYLAQVDPIFPVFGRVAPYQAPRPSATFIEKHNEKIMEQHGITFTDLTGDIEQVVNRVLAESFPQDIERQAAQLRQRIEEEFQRFAERSLQFDKQLESVANTTQGKIDFALKQFEAKVFAAHKRRSGETRDRIYRLYHALYTNRGLQERALNVSYFIAKYGFGFVTFAYEQLDSEEKAHQLIPLSEYRS